MDYKIPIYKVLDHKLEMSHYHLHEAFEALLRRIDVARASGELESHDDKYYRWHIEAAVELSTILLGIGEVERELGRRGIDIPFQDR